jgi:hypothetical protein
MRFFFDRCVPCRLARMVGAYEGANGHEVVHHDDGRFQHNTPDVEWIKALAGDGEPRWIIVSGDGRILRNSVERAALREAALPFFCLASQWMNMPFHDLAWRFIKAWSAIVKKADPKTCQIYELSAGKNLELILR